MDSVTKKVLTRIDKQRSLKTRIELIAQEKGLTYMEVREMMLEEYVRRDSNRIIVIPAIILTGFGCYRFYETQMYDGFALYMVVLISFCWTMRMLVLKLVLTAFWEDRL